MFRTQIILSCYTSQEFQNKSDHLRRELKSLEEEQEALDRVGGKLEMELRRAMQCKGLVTHLKVSFDRRALVCYKKTEKNKSVTEHEHESLIVCSLVFCFVAYRGFIRSEFRRLLPWLLPPIISINNTDFHNFLGKHALQTLVRNVALRLLSCYSLLLHKTLRLL